MWAWGKIDHKFGGAPPGQTNGSATTRRRASPCRWWRVPSRSRASVWSGAFARSWANPLAGINNVTFDDGVAWTQDISHGELLRDGYDETLTIDPGHLGFLYQGVDPTMTGVDYFLLPYRLALLTLVQP